MFALDVGCFGCGFVGINVSVGKLSVKKYKLKKITNHPNIWLSSASNASPPSRERSTYAASNW